jgi:hypothetical protein
MNLDRDSVLPLVQLKRPSSTRHTKMPMTATGTPGKLALAPNDETSSPALLKRVLGSEI